ncbi:MAG: transporter substrate-binding domain-containing protein, partial [Planctomycetota bacterium]
MRVLPDLPRWIETRAMLRKGARVVGGAEGAVRFAVTVRAAARATPVATVFLATLLSLLAPTHAMVATQPVPQDLLTAAERTWLAEHPVLRLAPSPSYPPVDFFDQEGHHTGYVADVFALIQQRLEIRFEVVHLTREKMLLQRPELMEIDVVPLSASTEGRRQNWLFGDPYLEFPAVIITRIRGGPQLLEPEDLAGMTVAVVEGYAVQSHIRTRYPEVRLQPVLDTRTG